MPRENTESPPKCPTAYVPHPLVCPAGRSAAEVRAGAPKWGNIEDSGAGGPERRSGDGGKQGGGALFDSEDSALETNSLACRCIAIKKKEA